MLDVIFLVQACDILIGLFCCRLHEASHCGASKAHAESDDKNEEGQRPERKMMVDADFSRLPAGSFWRWPMLIRFRGFGRLSDWQALRSVVCEYV